MQDKSLKFKMVFCAMISIVGWFAVLFQLYLIISNRVASLSETIVRFFSFFTIQTNILVAICFTCLWLKPKFKWGLFFSKATNLTAITLYILIVGLVYNVILRFLWAPTGSQKIVDELLHLVIPVFVLLYWIVFVTKKELEYNTIFPWLIFPFVYLIYTLIRGAFFNFYPYPFVDVNALGYSEVIRNSFFMLFAFLFFGIILITVGKRTAAKA